MNINQKKSTPSKGFTLTEMLVVIAILGTLAAIAFPLTRSIIDKGKEKESAMRMQEFESAVNAFNNDNGHLPHAGNSYPSDDNVSNTDLVEIVQILLNMEDATDKVNTTGRKYLLMPDAKNSKNGVMFLNNDKTAVGKNGVAMTDAWGNEYFVKIDYNLDGKLNHPGYSDLDQIQITGKSVSMISNGRDGDMNGDDDIYSWK